MDAHDDAVLKNKQSTELIDVLSNDIVHRNENFLHTTVISGSGTGPRISVHNPIPGEEYYWLQTISGTSRFTTREDGSIANVTFHGFQFLRASSLGCNDRVWGWWYGGTITITSPWGTRVITDAHYHAGVIVNRLSSDFGKVTAMISDLNNSIEIALPNFNGLSASVTTTGDGILRFANPPKITITSPPSQGSVNVESGAVRYTPQIGTEGTDSFEYRIMTELGDSDTANVNIGTMDLDISDLAGAELSETAEDDPGLLLPINNDDDNSNNNQDLLDSGFADNDLAKLKIKARAPAAMHALEGYYVLSFDSTKVRVWHQQDKSKPTNHANAEVQTGTTRFDIGDLGEDFEVWVEGLRTGDTNIQLSWHNTAPNGVSSVMDEVHVRVLDANLEFAIWENSPVGTYVGSIAGELFAIYRQSGGSQFETGLQSGVIRVADPSRLNFEDTPTIGPFNVVAFYADPSTYFVFHVTVKLLDVNEAPAFYGVTAYTTTRLQQVGFDFIDPEGNAVMSVSGNPQHGVLRVNPNQDSFPSPYKAFWVPKAEDFLGPNPAAGDAFAISASDGSLSSTAQNVTIAVDGSQDVFGAYRLIDPTRTVLPDGDHPTNKYFVDTDPGASGDVSKIEDPDYAWYREVQTQADRDLHLLMLSYNGVFGEYQTSVQAKRAMDIYLSNTNPDHFETLDVESILLLSDNARTFWDQSVLKLIQAIDSKAFVGSVELVEKSATLGNTSGSVYEKAVGEFTGWGNAKVTGEIVDNEIHYTAEFTYNIWDPYDWVPSGRGWTIWALARMHLVGLARQYMTEGSHTVTFSWTKGSPPVQVIPGDD